MIKTLIVDDDTEMLEGLRNIIRWEDYGFEVIALAENGIEALEIVKSQNVDLIMADITMPGMDGIELIREAKKVNEKVRAIILTCHESFAYAKDAINLKVDEYIVKYTFTKEELISLLLKIKKRIETEKFQQERIKNMNHQLELNKNVMKETFFNNIIKRKEINKDTIYEKGNFLNIALPDNKYRIVGLYIDNYLESIKQADIPKDINLKVYILNIIAKIFTEENKEVFFRKEDSIILLFLEDAKDLSYDKTNKIKKLQRMIKQNIRIELSVCISSILNNILELPDGIDELKKLRDEYFYEKTGKIIFGKKMSFKKDIYGIHELYEYYEQPYKKAIFSMDYIKIQKCLDSIFMKLAKEKIAPYYVNKLFLRLILDLEEVLNKEIIVDKYNLKGYTLNGYRKLFNIIAQEYIKNSDKKESKLIRKEIIKAKEYIESHLNENLSCELIAQTVNLNKNYFSRLFKKETNQSFSEYVMEKRVAKATLLLLQTNLSVEEITRKIGLVDPSYFYRLYKKETGKTPGSIRKK